MPVSTGVIRSRGSGKSVPDISVNEGSSIEQLDQYSRYEAAFIRYQQDMHDRMEVIVKFLTARYARTNSRSAEVADLVEAGRYHVAFQKISEIDRDMHVYLKQCLLFNTSTSYHCHTTSKLRKCRNIGSAPNRFTDAFVKELTHTIPWWTPDVESEEQLMNLPGMCRLIDALGNDAAPSGYHMTPGEQAICATESPVTKGVIMDNTFSSVMTQNAMAYLKYGSDLSQSRYRRLFFKSHTVCAPGRTIDRYFNLKGVTPDSVGFINKEYAMELVHHTTSATTQMMGLLPEIGIRLGQTLFTNEVKTMCKESVSMQPSEVNELVKNLKRTTTKAEEQKLVIDFLGHKFIQCDYMHADDMLTENEYQMDRVKKEEEQLKKRLDKRVASGKPPAKKKRTSIEKNYRYGRAQRMFSCKKIAYIDRYNEAKDLPRSMDDLAQYYEGQQRIANPRIANLCDMNAQTCALAMHDTDRFDVDICTAVDRNEIRRLKDIVEFKEAVVCIYNSNQEKCTEVVHAQVMECAPFVTPLRSSFAEQVLGQCVSAFSTNPSVESYLTLVVPMKHAVEESAVNRKFIAENGPLTDSSMIRMGLTYTVRIEFKERAIYDSIDTYYKNIARAELASQDSMIEVPPLQLVDLMFPGKNAHKFGDGHGLNLNRDDDPFEDDDKCRQIRDRHFCAQSSMAKTSQRGCYTAKKISELQSISTMALWPSKREASIHPIHHPTLPIEKKHCKTKTDSDRVEVLVAETMQHAQSNDIQYSDLDSDDDRCSGCTINVH